MVRQPCRPVRKLSLEACFFPLEQGRLPIKWTAPEHLFNDSMENDARVSEKSDV